ncbi:DUF2235 domain-containing protein [Pseudomonas sp. GD03842]|uniref:PAAR domain-containing protein n=1 Tax=Pseudomonas sp. GD03842 TaxID=2975385 RepID=UPI00244C0827|nr:PAAR domain-containing protein [Pseudomonas sp. GD03842]MDH0746712.1 DUF2235 domain-containing protein [Pseudomonas sp. GD03842]
MPGAATPSIGCKGLEQVSKGHFIRPGDRTTCGGVVLEGDGRFDIRGKPLAREGDRATCGATGSTFNIIGGIPHMRDLGRRVAGTLHSMVPCPCSARLLPSLLNATYDFNGDDSPSVPGAAHLSTYAPPAGPNSTQPPHRQPALADDLEEEEEEVELEQVITLRLGIFFDGTGNNQANSEAVAGCMARDVGLEHESEDIQRFCLEQGYGLDGSAPDSSYGNDTSNVARLYDLYRDQANEQIDPADDEASVAVYLDGIGTVSGGPDDLWGQGTGTGKNGVVARVEQSPMLVIERLLRFKRINPDIKVRCIEIDVFGFSRGAAAARHFANDIRKGANSLIAKAWPADASLLVEGFGWRVQHDVHLNFIGLFDTVPGIVTPLQLDFSPGNARNAGLDLGLPTGCARHIVQLVARDEHRLNFALIRTENDIVLPGAHSDIGGGYRPRMRERLLVAKPTSSVERKATPNERALAVSRSQQSVGPLVRRLIEQGVELEMHIWSEDEARTRDNQMPAYKRVYVMSTLEREVEGDLSKVYLRVMRELGLRHNAPFKEIPQTSASALPAELEMIAAKLQAYALGQASAPNLTASEEALLLRRYIHLSASWNAVKDRHRTDISALFINRPADDHRRIIHGNQ